MPIAARCKFRLISITDHGGSARELKLVTQYDNTVAEDRAFTKYTPSGSMQVMIDNPAVLERMNKPGQEFYVDIVPVPAKEA